MFVCKNCKSIDKFELMFSPEYRGNKSFESRKIDPEIIRRARMEDDEY
jgi:hypothetical protein